MHYIEKICCFFIFARIFLHMCPNEKYEKYISALTGWVAFFLFLSPFLSGEWSKQNYEMWNEQWQNRLEASKEEDAAMFQKQSEEVIQNLAEDIENLAKESE